MQVEVAPPVAWRGIRYGSSWCRGEGVPYQSFPSRTGERNCLGALWLMLKSEHRGCGPRAQEGGGGERLGSPWHSLRLVPLLWPQGLSRVTGQTRVPHQGTEGSTYGPQPRPQLQLQGLFQGRAL